jgi:drug/metabolite transporter (DMT)-like permease
MARANRQEPAPAVVAHATLVAAALSLLAAPILPGDGSNFLRVGPLAWASLAAIGLTAFWLGPALYFGAIERAGLLLPAVLMAAIPVFTLLLAWAVLASAPPAVGLLGIPIAVVGALLALRGEHAPWDRPRPIGGPADLAGPTRRR